MSSTPRWRGDRPWLVLFAASLIALVAASVWMGAGGSEAVRVAAEPVAQHRPTGAAPSTASTWTPPPSPAQPPTGPATPVSPGGPSTLTTWTARPVTPAPASTTDADVPTEFTIPRLGVDMPVRATGVRPDGQMQLPDHPSDIGWYRYGPAPGASEGSAVLAGHVDSRRYGIGPLVALRSLQRGDRINVRRQDGRQAAFVVSSVDLISKRTIPLPQLFRRTGEPQLTIVTCGGPYLPALGGYQDNVVISAAPQ